MTNGSDKQSGLTGPAGAATDSFGRAVLDPTKNVLDLVQAAITRLDDLNNSYREHYNLRFVQMDERLDREFSHISELRKAESDRIDAIRAVDVGNVAAAAAVSATQATTLAAQVATSAETLRNQVAAAATASTVALGAALDPIQKDIADLRRAQYEQQGQKAQVSESREVHTSTRQNLGLWIAAASVSFGVLLGITGIVITLLLRG
jgi:hypothetical protein